MYNKVILIGNLTKDPELQSLPSGTTLCKFSLAVNTRSKDKVDTLFIDVAAWGKQADFIAQFFSKGKPILIEGRLKTESWVGKDGKQMFKTIVVAESAGFIERRDVPATGAAPSYDLMINERKRIDPIAQHAARAYAPSPQKALDSNMLDPEELPF